MSHPTHEPCCPPESRCVICWDDDDTVIKALVTSRDSLLATLKNLMEVDGPLTECDCIYSDRTDMACPCKAAREAIAEAEGRA